jgi:hypothetical protein
LDTQTAKKPKHEENDQYQTQSAAEPSSTIPIVPVIAAATAEQQDEQDDD